MQFYTWWCVSIPCLHTIHVCTCGCITCSCSPRNSEFWNRSHLLDMRRNYPPSAEWHFLSTKGLKRKTKFFISKCWKSFSFATKKPPSTTQTSRSNCKLMPLRIRARFTATRRLALRRFQRDQFHWFWTATLQESHFASNCWMFSSSSFRKSLHLHWWKWIIFCHYCRSTVHLLSAVAFEWLEKWQGYIERLRKKTIIEAKWRVFREQLFDRNCIEASWYSFYSYIHRMTASAVMFKSDFISSTSAGYTGWKVKTKTIIYSPKMTCFYHMGYHGGFIIGLLPTLHTLWDIFMPP